MANVHYDFLCHLLKRVGSANLNGVKIINHLKPPIWKEKAMCMSFKTYSIDDFTQALSEQSVTNLCLSKAYNGKSEIANSARELSGHAALEAAKQKRNVKASLQSEITIGAGIGRATRECEFKWLPVYDSSSNGILTVRIYVGKVHL